jgi:methylmalonyl-CoA/ethylmalonyl-CoA epimerase
VALVLERRERHGRRRRGCRITWITGGNKVIRRFDHVGLAVKDLGKAVAFFQDTFGAKIVWQSTYEDQGIESVCVAIGEARFELTGSTKPGSVISRFIESKGEGIHHVSLQVDNFGAVLSKFTAKGLKVIGETDTKDFRAAFIHPAGNHGVLTEIIEPKPGGIMVQTERD